MRARRGELTDGIIDQLAKFERAKLTERTRRGLLRKAREGRLIGTASPKYGFRYNERRDGYIVHEPEMAVVEKILRLAAEGLGRSAIQRRLHLEGIRTQKGGEVWARTVIGRLIADDAYKPHSYPEVSKLVSPEVAARLHPDEEYGIAWYNRHKVTARPASEPDGNGGRRYKKRQIRTLRPREEWIAIPVPAHLPRVLVGQARAAFEANNGSERKHLARPWELRGLMRCSCGRKMGTQTATWKPKSEPTTINYHYYLCHAHKEYGGLATCTEKAVKVCDVEAPVWEFISGLLKDPERIRAGMERLIDQERASGHADPEREAKAWLEKLAEVDHQRARAQDLAIEGLLSPDELRTKLTNLAELRETAERELGVLQDRTEKMLELEADRDTLLESMTRMVPEGLDGLTGEERNKVYQMLRLEVTPQPEGGYGVTGAFCSFEPVRGDEDQVSHHGTRAGPYRRIMEAGSPAE